MRYQYSVCAFKEQLTQQSAMQRFRKPIAASRMMHGKDMMLPSKNLGAA